MKKLILPVLALAAFALPAAAQDKPRTIMMTGHGEVRAVPDQVQVNAGVTSNAATAAAALAANTARMKAVFAALTRLGIPDRNIQTVSFSVSPQYSGGTNNEAPRLTGYQVNNEVSVRLDDVGKLGVALDALVSAGANQMNGIAYQIKDNAALLAQARADAVADARTRAETYAKAAGVALGPVATISEGGNDGPRPMYRVAAMAAPVPVAAGELSVTADVSVTWDLR